ncbi:MAG TPA: hypothetical protein VE485_01470 [Mycobacterium sp.]|nr:hypothetical protein [Mycobacterium sp.]
MTSQNRQMTGMGRASRGDLDGTVPSDAEWTTSALPDVHSDMTTTVPATAPHLPAAGGPASGPSAADLWCVWCGLLFVLVAGLGLVMFIPPPNPGASATTIASYWADGTWLANRDVRRAGLILLAFGILLGLPFAAALSKQLRRIDGPGPVLAYVQIGGGAIATTMGMMYVFMWFAILLHPQRPPEITAAMTDISWLGFVGAWTPGWLQAVALGVGVFADRDGATGLPRWLGYLSFWYCFAALAGALVGFFDVGPFAWNGLVAFYVGGFAYFTWYVTSFVALRRAVLAAPLQSSRA